MPYVQGQKSQVFWGPVKCEAFSNDAQIRALVKTRFGRENALYRARCYLEKTSFPKAAGT